MRHYLAPLDATIIEASDGTDALEKVTSHPDLSIILLDVHMPGMDGLGFAAEYQKLVQAGQLPKVTIIMVTTETTRKIAAAAQKLGISGWLVKPPRQEILLDVVTRMATRSERVA
jgi:CheY-like chemotaxis protein